MTSQLMTAPAEPDAPPDAEPPPRSAVADPGRAGPGPAHGGAGRHHREYRPADGPARAWLLRCRPPMDRDRLRPVLRQPAVARRSPLRHPRPQAGPHDRSGRVRRRLGPRWLLHQLHHAVLRPGAPGLLRRLAGPGRLGHADHDIHRPERSRAGLRHLRRHFRRLAAPSACYSEGSSPPTPRGAGRCT